MAFKSRKGIYNDRPLLTEDEIDYLIALVKDSAMTYGKNLSTKMSVYNKLYKSKHRISMLKLN